MALKRERKERVAKNKKQQLRNLKLAPGQKNRVEGALDLTSVVAAQQGKRKQKKQKGNHHVDVALAISQRSTASDDQGWQTASKSRSAANAGGGNSQPSNASGKSKAQAKNEKRRAKKRADGSFE